MWINRMFKLKDQCQWDSDEKGVHMFCKMAILPMGMMWSPHLFSTRAVSQDHEQQRIGDEQQAVKKNKVLMMNSNKNDETQQRNDERQQHMWSTEDSYIKATKKVVPCVVGPSPHQNDENNVRWQSFPFRCPLALVCLKQSPVSASKFVHKQVVQM